MFPRVSMHNKNTLIHRKPAGERDMPVLILWAGIPLLILGSGFMIYRIVGG